MAGIRDCGFATCTPIQALTLPLTLAGTDVAGQAQTGTGKTAAFLIACLTRLVRSDEARRAVAGETPDGDPAARPKGVSAPRILIIAPTRELVVQIEQDATALAAHTHLNIHAVYGGVDYDKQRQTLVDGGVDMLVGTPGRLIDYFKQHAYVCTSVEALVIDEADRMFDMGFIADLRYLLRRLPPYEKRLSLLFSATLSYRAQELSYEYMGNPEVLSTPMDIKTVQQVTQCLYHVEGSRKISLLVGLLRRDLSEEEGSPGGRVMIFVNTKRMGERLQAWLFANAILNGYLSGDVPQEKRLKVLQRFQQGELPVLIATDVAGRGLHIDGVTHVINYDLPENAEDYVHRIGRTARAGARGDAISLVDEEGAYNLEAIEAYGGMKIPVVWADDALYVELKRPPRPPREERPDGRSGSGGGGRFGGSRSGSSRSGFRSGSGRSGSAFSPVGATQAPPAEEPKKRKKRRRRNKPVDKPAGTGGDGGAAS